MFERFLCVLKKFFIVNKRYDISDLIIEVFLLRWFFKLFIFSVTYIGDGCAGSIEWVCIPTGHLFEMLIYSEEFNLAHSSCPVVVLVPCTLSDPFTYVSTVLKTPVPPCPRDPSHAVHDLIFRSRSAVRFVALWTREYIKSGFCVCWRLHTYTHRYTHERTPIWVDVSRESRC